MRNGERNLEFISIAVSRYSSGCVSAVVGV